MRSRRWSALPGRTAQRATLRSLCFAVLGALFVGGCSQATEAGADPLDGRWEWIDASGGIAGTTRTPVSEGYTMSIVHRAAGTTARFQVFRNDSLFAETTVRRSEASSGTRGTLVYGDPVLGWPEQDFEIRTDTLVLRDGCCDGFTYRFFRGTP